MVEKNTVFIDDLPMYKVLNTKVTAKIYKVWTNDKNNHYQISTEKSAC